MKFFILLTPRSLHHSVVTLYSLLVALVVPQLCAQPLVGESWRSRSPNPTGENLTSLTLAGSNTIAVGNLKTVLRSSTSSHGLSWTASKAAITEDIYQESTVAYNGTKLLLCSNDGFMQSTNSGVSWSAITTNLPSFNRVYSLAVQGTQFMALMQTGIYPNNVVSLITSTDGAAWTIVGVVPGASPTVSLYVNKVASSGSRYVIVGYRYDTAAGAYQGELWSTVDGSSWSDTVLSGATDSTNLSDVIWSGQAFVALGNSAYRSTDGITWTPSTLGFYATCLAKKDTTVSGLMVALGYDTSATSSDDGVTWTLNTSAAPVPFRPRDVLWDGTTWIAVGEGGTVYTSASAGTTWLRRYPSGAVTDFTAVASNDSNLYLALDTDFHVWSSSSGSSWNLLNPSATFDGAKGIIWDGTQFVIVSNFFCWTTTDGTSFDGSAQFGPSNQDPDVMTTLAHFGTKYVAIGYNQATNDTVIYSATVLNNWIKRTVPAGLPLLHAITRAGTLWIAAGDDGTIVTSPDGATWTKRTTDAAGYNFDSIASSGSITIASSSGGGGSYYISTNGIAWAEHGNNGDGYYQFNCVVGAEDNFVAINTYGGQAQTSTDGLHWSSYPTYTSANLKSMAWSGTEVLAVGERTTMISSDLVPVINFAAASQSAFESSGTVTVTVNLSAPTTSTVTLPITVDAASTAVANTDYTPPAANVVFDAGELTKTFTVALLDNATIATDKTLKLNIAAVSGTRLGTQASHTLTIIDDDSPPTMQFVTTAQTAPEHAGTVAAEVVLSWPAPGAITVNLTPTGSADTNDFTAPTTLSFSAGERRKTLAIAITDDSTVEPVETVVFTLTSPSGATLGSNAAFTLSIQDNDPASTPGKRWTLRQPNPSADTLWSITAAPFGHVIVGDGGTVLTSADSGVSWTRRFTGMPPNTQLTNVAWTGSTLIATGSEGHLATSTDGISWIDRTVANASQSMSLRGVASNGTRHVAIGFDYSGSDPLPIIYTSNNGTDWTAAAPPADVVGYLNGVAWNGSIFTAVGYHWMWDASTQTSSVDSIIFTSADGLTWTDRSAALPHLWLSAITAGGSTFVAFDDTSSCYTSTDGIAWTKRSLGGSKSISAGVWNGSNKFIAVGGAVTTSANGTSWSTQTPSPVNAYLSGISFKDGVYVAITGPGGVYTSPDAINWTKRGTGFENFNALHGVTWSGTQFVAVGESFDNSEPSLICNSPDGIAWTQVVPAFKKTLLSVAWSGTSYIAVGLNGAIVGSTNGTAWTTKTSGTNLDLHQVIWARNQFIVVGGHETGEDYSTGTGGSIVLTSPDGSKWTRRTVPTDHPLEGIVFTGTQYVAVGRASADSVGYNTGEAEILTSPDAITWTHRSSGLMGLDLQRVAYNGSVFVATNENFGILRSTDGITWAPASSLPAAPPTAYLTELYDVLWTGTNFVTVGNSGISLNSTDGNTWLASQTELYSDRLYGLAWNGQTLVAVGAHASVQTSGPGGTPSVPAVNFASASSSVSESAGVANILVTLSSAPTAKATVTLTNDTPANGLELTGANADVTLPVLQLIFNPGETEKYFSIAIKNDKLDEVDELLGLHLSAVTGGATLGTTQTSHSLTITDDDTAPSATAPTSQLVTLGSPIVLSVTATGSAPLVFQWKKNGVAVPASVIGSKSATLFISQSKITDGGDYTCFVSNGVGSGFTSTVAKVGVYEAKNAQPEVSSLGVKSVVLTQPASNNCVFHWTKDTVDITSSPPAGITFNANKSTMTIGDIPSNGGIYACQVELPGVNAAPFPKGDSWGVNHVTAAPMLTSITSLTAGAIGQYYIYHVQGSSVTKWTAVGLPKGLSIDPDSGHITGYPSVSNSVPKQVTITATNAKGSTVIKPTIVVSGLDLALIGSHTGLLDRDATNDFLGGSITITVTSVGTCTASYQIGSTKYAITGAVSSATATTFRMGNPLGYFGQPSALINNKPVEIFFDYDPSNPTSSGATGSGKIRTTTPGGSVIDTNFETRRALTGTPVADYAGRHNFALQLATSGDIGNVLIPQGHGFGSATISATGAITYAGKTGDGSVITASSPLNTGSTSPLYAVLYKGQGSLSALPLFTLGGSSPTYEDTTIIDITTASWNKRPDLTPAGARNYPAGWAPLLLKLEGSRYTKPDTSSVVMGLDYLGVGYSNADLTFDVEASDPTPNATPNIRPDGKIDPIFYNPRKLSCTVKPLDGTFSGSVDFSETLANNLFIARAANKFEGQIVRIIGNSPEEQGYGFVTYPLLPDINISPLPSSKLTPIVTSIVTLAPQ